VGSSDPDKGFCPAESFICSEANNHKKNQNNNDREKKEQIHVFTDST
jgi:hypothetical protein